jgi:hypothetical protein
MKAISVLFKTTFALTGAAAFLAGQSGANLTARELFFVPAEVTSNKAPAPMVSKAQTPAAAQKATQQVASKGKAPAKTPAAQPAVTPQEIRTDNEVRLVTASYSGPRPLGLKYSILKQDAPRRFRPVNVDSVFRSGDSIRVRVESNENGYLYILTRGSSGAWTVLFPKKEIRGGDNFIEAGEKHDLPSSEHRWTFDEKKGEEKLFLVLSRKPVADVDKMIYDLNDAGKPAAVKPVESKAPEAKKGPTTPPVPTAPEAPRRTMLAQNVRPIDDQLVGRLRSQMLTRDLVFETVAAPAITPTSTSTEESDERVEAAAYVVEKSGKPDARLVVDIKLKHD